MGEVRNNLDCVSSDLTTGRRKGRRQRLANVCGVWGASGPTGAPRLIPRTEGLRGAVQSSKWVHVIYAYDLHSIFHSGFLCFLGFFSPLRLIAS